MSFESYMDGRAGSASAEFPGARAEGVFLSRVARWDDPLGRDAADFEQGWMDYSDGIDVTYKGDV
jgi:hypothetical protein